MEPKDEAFITKFLLKELIDRAVEFRFLNKPPTSIFKVFKGRTIAHVVQIREEFGEVEVTIDGMHLSDPVFVLDIMNHIGFMEQPIDIEVVDAEELSSDGKRKMRRLDRS